MRNHGKLWLTAGMLLVAPLCLPETAWALHTLKVVGGPPKFDPAFLLLSAAPYCVFGIIALVIYRNYRRQ